MSPPLGGDVIVHGVALGWLEAGCWFGMGVEGNSKICVALPATAKSGSILQIPRRQKSHVRFDVHQKIAPSKTHDGKDKDR